MKTMKHSWRICLLAGALYAGQAHAQVDWNLGGNLVNLGTDYLGCDVNSTAPLHFADPNSVFPWYPRGYTLIDAVCVSPNPAGCDLGQGVGEEFAEGPVLFPNPAHDQLVVGGRSGARLLAMDAVGRVIWQGVVESDRWVLPVGAWARGAYVLRLERRGRTEVHKFVLAE